MDQTYRGSGISFRYPDDWQLTEEQRENEFSVTVGNEETSFWNVTLLFTRPLAEHVIEAAVAALRDDYPELDDYPADEEIAHRPAIGRDVDFLCMELTNSVSLRSLRTGRFTILVMFQGTDHELQTTRPILQAITRSLECEFDGDLIIV